MLIFTPCEEKRYDGFSRYWALPRYVLPGGTGVRAVYRVRFARPDCWGCTCVWPFFAPERTDRPMEVLHIDELGLMRLVFRRIRRATLPDARSRFREVGLPGLPGGRKAGVAKESTPNHSAQKEPACGSSILSPCGRRAASSTAADNFPFHIYKKRNPEPFAVRDPLSPHAKNPVCAAGSIAWPADNTCCSAA